MVSADLSFLKNEILTYQKQYETQLKSKTLPASSDLSFLKNEILSYQKIIDKHKNQSKKLYIKLFICFLQQIKQINRIRNIFNIFINFIPKDLIRGFLFTLGGSLCYHCFRVLNNDTTFLPVWVNNLISQFLLSIGLFLQNYFPQFFYFLKIKVPFLTNFLIDRQITRRSFIKLFLISYTKIIFSKVRILLIHHISAACFNGILRVFGINHCVLVLKKIGCILENVRIMIRDHGGEDLL